MLTKYNTDLAQITIFHLSYKYLKKKINTSISIKHFLISYYLTIDVGSLAIVIVWWTVVGHPRLYPPGRRSRVSIPTKGNKELYTQPCKVKTGDINKVYMIFICPQPWSSRFTYFTPVYAHDPDCHIYMPLDQSVHHAWQVYVLDPGCHMCVLDPGCHIYRSLYQFTMHGKCISLTLVVTCMSLTYMYIIRHGFLTQMVLLSLTYAFTLGQYSKIPAKYVLPTMQPKLHLVNAARKQVRLAIK